MARIAPRPATPRWIVKRAPKRPEHEVQPTVIADVIMEQVGKPQALSFTAIAVNKLTKKFLAPGAESWFTVLDSISLSVDEGEFVSIVGPSGCGKSTLLNIIVGIESYESGSVTV